MKHIKFLEPALALGLAISLMFGAAAAECQQALSEKLVRLHIVANSDSAEDQQLKLAVRDRVLSEISALSASDPYTARQQISEMLHEIELAAQDELSRHGCDHPVKARLCRMYFDTREYENFSLPAGMYDACRIEIGNARGRNWWCVMFPPLCLSATEAEFASAADAAGLTEHERELIASGKTVYRAKFKTLELFSKMKHYFDCIL